MLLAGGKSNAHATRHGLVVVWTLIIAILALATIGCGPLVPLQRLPTVEVPAELAAEAGEIVSHPQWPTKNIRFHADQVHGDYRYVVLSYDQIVQPVAEVPERTLPQAALLVLSRAPTGHQVVPGWYYVDAIIEMRLDAQDGFAARCVSRPEKGVVVCFGFIRDRRAAAVNIGLAEGGTLTPYFTSHFFFLCTSEPGVRTVEVEVLDQRGRTLHKHTW